MNSDLPWSTLIFVDHLTCTTLATLAAVWLHAQYGELGKLAGRAGKIDQILDEIRKVKLLETQIGAGDWTRQWILDRKHEVYKDVLGDLGEIGAIFQES